MRFAPRSALGLVACAMLAAAPACDSTYTGLLGAIPREPTDDPVHVILGLDGMSRAAYDLARSRGAFADFFDGDVVTVFPGSSEYSWTRTLHAPSMPGYNVSYYDQKSDSVVGGGLVGVASHAVHEGNADVVPCWDAFDFLGDDETWLLKLYSDPEAALPATMDNLFASVAGLGATGRRRIVVYLANVDVIGHLYSVERSAAALAEISRRVDDFRDRHPNFHFSVISDHGNTHQKAELIDVADALKEVGVAPVDHLDGAPSPSAIPIVHVRVSYVGLVTRQPEDVAARISRHATVDVAVARLPTDAQGRARFGVFKDGRRFTFAALPTGGYRVDEPVSWREHLAVPFATDAGDAVPVTLSDEEALRLTVTGPRPDIFHRIHGAFTSDAVARPDDVIVSFTDKFASFGFHLPGADNLATAGFHGNLLRGGTMSVLASQLGAPPALLRGEDALAALDALADRAGLRQPP